jgi:hypothetical protein
MLVNDLHNLVRFHRRRPGLPPCTVLAIAVIHVWFSPCCTVIDVFRSERWRSAEAPLECMSRRWPDLTGVDPSRAILFLPPVDRFHLGVVHDLVPSNREFFAP